MEQKLGKGGPTDDSKAKEEYKQLQLKKKKLRAKEKKMREEAEQREEQLNMIEGEYKSLQEEAEGKGKMVSRLKKRYKAALQEIKDLESEHQSNKEDLLDSIRFLERDLDFYKQIVSMVMKEDQLYKIKAKSSFDEESNNWKVPAFILKKQEVNLPQLGEKKNMELVKENLDQILEFDDSQNGKRREQLNRQSQSKFAPEGIPVSPREESDRTPMGRNSSQDVIIKKGKRGKGPVFNSQPDL